MNKPFFRCKFHLFALMPVVFCCVLFSCRKTDALRKALEINYEEKFFTIPANVKPAVLKVINKIKEQNNQYHFVNEFVKKHGFPKWDYAEVRAVKRLPSSADFFRDAGTPDSLVFIPIANDVMIKIKDVLACDVNAGDVAIQLINDYTYKYYGYELHPDGTANAADIAKMFMNYEYKVYQKKIFEITDVELAKELFGTYWEAELKNLIIKEDPITEQVGFYAAKEIVTPVTPSGTIIIDPLTPIHPVSIYETPTIGPVILQWWWDPNGVYVPGGGGGSSDGSDPAGGGDTGGSGGQSGDGGDAGGGNGGGGSTGSTGEGAPGSPGTGGSGGTNGGGEDEEPGWQEPECGGYWQGEEFIRILCPDSSSYSDTTFNSDSIPGILSRACNKQADSVFTWGLENNFREQSFILVKSGENIYPKNYLPGTPNGDKTKVNYTLLPGEILLGYFHTHPVEIDSTGRSFFSFNDIQEARKNAAIPYYCAILECGNKRFALVIEKPDLLNRFITLEKLMELKNLKLEENAMELPIYNSNRQQASIDAVLSYFGSSSICGISFFEASIPNKTIFTKLNP